MQVKPASVCTTEGRNNYSCLEGEPEACLRAEQVHSDNVRLPVMYWHYTVLLFTFIISALGTCVCVHVYVANITHRRWITTAPCCFRGNCCQQRKNAPGAFSLMAHLYRCLLNSCFTSLVFWPLTDSCIWASRSVTLYWKSLDDTDKLSSLQVSRCCRGRDAASGVERNR